MCVSLCAEFPDYKLHARVSGIVLTSNCGRTTYLSGLTVFLTTLLSARLVVNLEERYYAYSDAFLLCVFFSLFHFISAVYLFALF